VPPEPVRTDAARPSQLVMLTAASSALVLLTGAWAFVDPRLIDGVPVWMKPLKFATSFVVLFVTLELVDRRLSPAWRNCAMLKTTKAVMAIAMIIEMAYIIAMAALQHPSHFNTSSPFTIFMYGVMGVGAVSLALGVAAYGVAALRDVHAQFGPGLRWGVGWGFILSCGLTLLIAGYMSATGTHVGAEPHGAATLPLIGWSGSVGDIRPAHFLALHAMQVLPIVGLWLDGRGLPSRSLRWAALAYAGVTAAVFAQALAGSPLIRL
jgi:hypothetical protein